MEYEELLVLALTLPDVEIRLHFREPSAKRTGRIMLTRGHVPGACAVKLDWQTHDQLLARKARIYFKTPHYEGSPWLLARLDALDPEEAASLLHAAWEDAPNPARKAKTSTNQGDRRR